MPRLRNIVASVATYLQLPDGSNGQICDRGTFESFGLTTPEIIQARGPLLAAGKDWSETDEDTDVVIADPAAVVPAAVVQTSAPADTSSK